jgi:hypothetical protein
MTAVWKTILFKEKAMLLVVVLFSLALSDRASAGPGGPMGTRIVGKKTASTVFNQIETYTWKLSESLSPPTQTDFVLPRGQSGVAGFTVNIQKTGPDLRRSNTPVAGTICLRNRGPVRTQGLRIRDRLQMETAPGVWTTIASIDSLPMRDIPAGGSRCINYSYDIQLDPEAHYRNLALASIWNYSGYVGTDHVTVLVAPVLSETRISEIQVIDDQAEFLNPVDCPEGFSCQVEPYPTLLNGSATRPISITLSNLSAECGQTLSGINTATLTPQTTRVALNSSAEVRIYTGSCRPGTDSGRRARDSESSRRPVMTDRHAQRQIETDDETPDNSFSNERTPSLGSEPPGW